MKIRKQAIACAAALLLMGSSSFASTEQAGVLSPWENQASSTAAWLPSGEVSASDAQNVQGENILIYWAIRAAPNVTAFLSGTIANHFPARVLMDAWNAYHGTGGTNGGGSW